MPATAEQKRAYYAANKEKIRAQNRASYERNKEAWKARKTEEQKVARAEYSRAHREKNREKLIADARAYYHDPANKDRLKEEARSRARALRVEVINHYGGRCACCGESELGFLSIDHINNDGAEHRRQLAGGESRKQVNIYSWLKKNGYPKGFQVLCMNCNCGKAWNGGVCPHQAGKFSELSKSAVQTKSVPPT